MKLLAIETATEACSAALLMGESVLQRYEVAPRAHANLILPMVQSLLDEAGLVMTDLDALAFGRGPGSFTGVRIATGVIQGLAFAAELPVLPVSTLAAVAQGARREMEASRVLAAIDARMGEVYWGAYVSDADGLMQLVGQECVVPPEQVTVPDEGPWIGSGSGWGSYAEALTTCVGGSVIESDGTRLPQARDIAQLAQGAWRRGEAVAAEQALPIYLRDNVAKKKGEKR